MHLFEVGANSRLGTYSNKYGIKFYSPSLCKWKGIKYLEYAWGILKLRFDQYIKLFSDINYTITFIIPDDSGLKGTLRQLAKASRRFTALPFDINNLSMCVSLKKITEVYPLKNISTESKAYKLNMHAWYACELVQAYVRSSSS